MRRHLNCYIKGRIDCHLMDTLLTQIREYCPEPCFITIHSVPIVPCSLETNQIIDTMHRTSERIFPSRAPTKPCPRYKRRRPTETDGIVSKTRLATTLRQNAHRPIHFTPQEAEAKTPTHDCLDDRTEDAIHSQGCRITQRR